MMLHRETNESLSLCKPTPLQVDPLFVGHIARKQRSLCRLHTVTTLILAHSRVLGPGRHLVFVECMKVDNDMFEMNNHLTS